MDLTEGSETSAKLNQTPGKYPKENIQFSEHGENLKSRVINKYFSQMQYTTSCVKGCRNVRMVQYNEFGNH
jgi:predicted solute-binding protein